MLKAIQIWTCLGGTFEHDLWRPGKWTMVGQAKQVLYFPGFLLPLLCAHLQERWQASPSPSIPLSLSRSHVPPRSPGLGQPSQTAKEALMKPKAWPCLRDCGASTGRLSLEPALSLGSGSAGSLPGSSSGLQLQPCSAPTPFPGSAHTAKGVAPVLSILG